MCVGVCACVCLCFIGLGYGHMFDVRVILVTLVGDILMPRYNFKFDVVGDGYGLR